MVGCIISTKYPIEDKFVQEKLCDAVQLKEPHEAGEIINNHWLICNNGIEPDEGKYSKGYYVRAVNLNLIDLFATDIDYDNRKDIKKYGMEFISGKKVNVYKFIS